MFQIVQKLKCVKGELKKLNREEFGDIAPQDTQAFQIFQSLQDDLHSDPTNEDIANRERKAQEEYIKSHKTYMIFFWLKR